MGKGGGVKAMREKRGEGDGKKECMVWWMNKRVESGKG